MSKQLAVHAAIRKTAITLNWAMAYFLISMAIILPLVANFSPTLLTAGATLMVVRAAWIHSGRGPYG